MIKRIRIAVVRWLSAALCGTALAGVPLSWNVDVQRVEPVRLDAYHGETLDLSATLMQGRARLAVPAGSASFLWQTNGMGAAWWQTNATASADGVVRGTFGPAMDTGADSVRFFFSVVSGSGANYRAAGTIALRASPGATPTRADLAPQTAINFADYQLVNAPWLTASAVSESVRAATNDLATVLQASDNALSSAIADAAQAATNYADSAAASVHADLVAVSNALVSEGSQLVATAATASSNYTDAAVAAIAVPSLDGYATEAWTHQAISNAIPTVPSLDGYATEAWVQGLGYLTEHQPLAGYATEAWVQGLGYLTEHQSLDGYATETWTHQAISNAIPAVPSLDGYATEAWVQGLGYLTEHQSLDGYATEAWVLQTVTNAQPSGAISLDGYATEAWVQGLGYLTEHQSLSGYATEEFATTSAYAARESAESYARSLSWGASVGNTRLVSLDGATWQDATGTVWQTSEIYGWSGTVIDLSTSAARPITFNYAGKADTFYTPNADYWSAGGGTNLYFATAMYETWALWFTNTYYGAESNSNWIADGTPPPSLSATNITISTSNEFYRLYYRPVALATNPVDRVLYSSDSVFRALTYGTPTRWTDATGCVWEVQTTRVCADAEEEWTYTIDGQTYTREQMIEAAGGDEGYSMILDWEDSTFINKDEDNEEFEGWYVLDGSGTAPVGYNYSTGLIPSYASDPYLAQVTYNGNITATRGDLVTVTNLVGRVALTNDIPAAPDLSPIQQDLADLRTESALVYRLYSGSNVVAEVTNYNSQVHAPALRLMQLNESNEYVTVWTETNGLARTLREATNYTDRAIADYAAPRAWSRTTSGLGAEAPANTTWISTPTTVIAGGLEYAKFVDTYGEVWVLSSNGMAAEFNPDTNAYFRITADDGTPIFSIEKTDAQLLGANSAGITLGESTVTIPVPVVSTIAPTMYWSHSLSSGDWADESSPPTGATVTWTGTTGAWVCTVAFTGTRPPSMFFKFKFLQEGGVVIRNNATTDLSSGIYVNGTKFVPTVSGNNLIWTKQQ